MPEDFMSRLQAIDLALLTDVVRQDQRSPSFEITEWSIKRLSDKGVQNPDGLWLVSGCGHAGTRRSTSTRCTPRSAVSVRCRRGPW